MKRLHIGQLDTGEMIQLRIIILAISGSVALADLEFNLLPYNFFPIALAWKYNKTKKKILEQFYGTKQIEFE